MAKFDKAVWGTLALAASVVATFEGLRLVAYLDPPGIPTICYGSTSGVKIGDTATAVECQTMLKSDLMAANDTFNRLVRVNVSEQTRAAFLSFIFNVGSGNFAKSTALKKLNRGDIAGACNELLRWTKAGGKEIKGLVNRRKEENRLCLAGL